MQQWVWGQLQQQVLPVQQSLLLTLLFGVSAVWNLAKLEWKAVVVVRCPLVVVVEMVVVVMQSFQSLGQASRSVAGASMKQPMSDICMFARPFGGQYRMLTV
jgi:hypothetical protein